MRANSKPAGAKKRAAKPARKKSTATGRTAPPPTIEAPAASDPPIALADYIELLAVDEQDRNASIQDLVQTLRRSGSTEGLRDEDAHEDDLAAQADVDAGAEFSQERGEAAFDEIEDRHRACDGCYPFEVIGSAIQAADDPRRSVYTFLLLLSAFGIAAGGSGTFPERTFEEVSRFAALQYFGGDTKRARAVHFGFPRRLLPKDFPRALEELCSSLGDASMNGDHPRAKEQKDGKLDIVAWRDFADLRPGKLVGFGQCAAGRTDWRGKVTEMQPQNFQKKWLRTQLSVEPVRMFFVPQRVAREEQRDICIEGGILFDRCRIASLCADLESAVLDECHAWTTKVVSRGLRRAS